jgi:para-nitrobenzyl esterase
MKMSDNCLNLNVFMPISEEKNNSKLYPVLVMFHGGNLKQGSSADLGVFGIVRNFVQKGIVVVTPNFRLGVLGNRKRIIY